MSDVVIRVENLGKRYRIGQIVGYKTLRESLTNAAVAPFRRLRSIRHEPSPASHHEPRATSHEPSPVSHHPDTIWALKDVSFDVERGQAVGIIGRNGAGKSTLLKVLTRITAPTEGVAEIRGRVGSLLEVGTGFHQELSGRENIYLNGAVLGMKRKVIERRYDEIVDFAGDAVVNFIDTPLKRYSSGMQVRLAFSVAAHLEPEILLVDEVLAVGDAEFQKRCLGKMGEVARGGRTVLFVSHNMGSIQSLCERAIWLDGGRVRLMGSASEVVTQYLSAVAEGTLRGQSDGPVQVTQVVLRNSAGQPTTTFSPGDDIDVLVRYVAKQRYERPIIWISVAGLWGGIFSANMFMDGQRPEYIEGEGFIGCRFKAVPLVPQSYTLVMAFRAADRSALFQPQPVAAFHVVGALSDFGLMGEVADTMAQVSDPMIIPYEWYYPDGKRTAVGIGPSRKS